MWARIHTVEETQIGSEFIARDIDFVQILYARYRRELFHRYGLLFRTGPTAVP